jgi:hypothetical protein
MTPHVDSEIWLRRSHYGNNNGSPVTILLDWHFEVAA